MSEILVFEEDVDMKEGEGKWPVEVLVGVTESGHLTVLNRDSNKLVLSQSLPVEVEEVRGGGRMAPGAPGKFSIYYYYWRASEASETLSGVTLLKIGDVCMFGRTDVILYFDPRVFLCLFRVRPRPKLH